MSLGTRMILGQWILVASSDDDSSVLSCWSIPKVLQGDIEIVATCHLPGPVNTAKTLEQSDGAIIALRLGQP